MAKQKSDNEKPRVTDAQLLARYRDGDIAAFESLIHRYRNELFHFLIRFSGNRALAEDVFQETFLQVHLSADSFDTSRRFKPWLFTIAANKARDQLRKKSRRPAAALSAPIGDEGGQTFLDLMQADLPMPDERMESDEIGEMVREVIDSMADHLKEILLLAYFNRLSYQEIAEQLDIPLGTVKSRLHTAVGNFAEKWKRLNPEIKET